MAYSESAMMSPHPELEPLTTRRRERLGHWSAALKGICHRITFAREIEQPLADDRVFLPFSHMFVSRGLSAVMLDPFSASRRDRITQEW